MAQVTPLMQAALSHYRAKRDACLASLDIYLNKPVGVGDHATIVDEVIKLFGDLESASSTIEIIEDVINSQPSLPVLAPMPSGDSNIKPTETEQSQ